MQLVKESKDATRRLVAFSVKTSYQDLPTEAIHATKRMILDCIGVTLVGSLFPKAIYVIETMQEMSGAPQATIISTPTKVPAPNAAFANAELLHGTEMSPVFRNFAHMTPFLFPTILSVAEYTQANGKDFIAALAVGFDVSARIGLSLSPLAYVKGDTDDISKMALVEGPETYGYGWVNFGCVAGGGRLLGLDEEHMANAFGLAGYTAPVPSFAKYIFTLPPSMIRYTIAGWQSQNAVTSLLLAKKGYTGDKEVLDGPHGFWKFWGSIRWDTNALFDAIGEKWWVTEQTYKLRTMCSLTYNNIELTRKLVEENNLKPEEIEAIDYYGNPHTLSALHTAEPEEIKDEMEAVQNARYAIAMTVLGWAEKTSDWALKRYWEDERVKNLMKKVKIKVHPETKELIYQQIGTKPYPGIYKWPAEMVIKARGGEFRAYQEYFKGHDAIADSRLSDYELKEKFLGNALQALPQDKCKHIVDTVMNLDKLDNIETLTQHLRP